MVAGVPMPGTVERRLGRRQFLVTTGTSGALLALGACGGTGRTSGSAATTTPGSVTTTPPSRLVLRPAGPDLALPPGFEYVVVSSTADGTMPPAPDGMVCIAAPDGSVRLVRNHERGDAAGVAPPLDAATAYDPSAAGGVMTVILAPDLRSAAHTHVSLSGTVQNCSGGLTPSGTWLSCEETHEGIEAGRGQPHGYVFEVDPLADGPSPATPLLSLGRFLHEAVAVVPDSGIVYMAEDNGYDSGVYRFTPTVPGRLAEGGALEMLSIEGKPGYDTAYDQRVGSALPVTWVAIDDPDPPSAGTDSSAVFNQGFDRGGARFKRVEGCCLVGSTCYLAVTEGGDAGLGQVWTLDPARSELRLVFEPAGPEELFGPDTLAPAPFGDGVLICEDNGNGDPNRLQVLDAAGRLVTFAENLSDATEFAGPCMSPDGSVLFVNIYGDEAAGVPGRTLAVWGPWDSLS